MSDKDLSAEELRRRFYYDPLTGVFTRKVSLHPAYPVGSVAGTITHKGYVAIGINGRYYKGHRLAWLYVHGEWPPSEVDHLNRIKSDNSIKNLQPKTRSGNTLNCVQPRVTNKLGLLGVSKVGGRYIARLQVEGEERYLGIFKSPQEASAAYWEAKKGLHHEAG
jgi:hypothetical protein